MHDKAFILGVEELWCNLWHEMKTIFEIRYHIYKDRSGRNLNMLYENIKKLVEYGIQTGLTPECERIYTTNLLLELFHEDAYEEVEIGEEPVELEPVLEALLDEAVKRGIIEDSIGYRDLFDTKIMNCLVP